MQSNVLGPCPNEAHHRTGTSGNKLCHHVFEESMLSPSIQSTNQALVAMKDQLVAWCLYTLPSYAEAQHHNSKHGPTITASPTLSDLRSESTSLSPARSVSVFSTRFPPPASITSSPALCSSAVSTGHRVGGRSDHAQSLFSTLSNSESCILIPTQIPECSSQVAERPDCAVSRPQTSKIHTPGLTSPQRKCFSISIGFVGCGQGDYSCYCSPANNYMFGWEILPCLHVSCGDSDIIPAIRSFVELLPLCEVC